MGVSDSDGSSWLMVEASDAPGWSCSHVLRGHNYFFSLNKLIPGKAAGHIWRTIMSRQKSLTYIVPASVQDLLVKGVKWSSCDWYLPSPEMLKVYVHLNIEFRCRTLIRCSFPLHFIPISSEFCLHLEAGCCKLLTCPLCLVFSSSCWQMAVLCEHSLLFVLNNKVAAAYIVCCLNYWIGWRKIYKAFSYATWSAWHFLMCRYWYTSLFSLCYSQLFLQIFLMFMLVLQIV